MAKEATTIPRSLPHFSVSASLSASEISTALPGSALGLTPCSEIFPSAGWRAVRISALSMLSILERLKVSPKFPHTLV